VADALGDSPLEEIRFPDLEVAIEADSHQHDGGSSTALTEATTLNAADRGREHVKPVALGLAVQPCQLLVDPAEAVTLAPPGHGGIGL
jgi:hypothetical protein